ncbi:MAG TPA: DUF2127 domain-containing protein [Ktedonobacterales bacterium]|jgi:uncharacterized membrane protein|nr:DUF2127 domain-containing protein [Ktedonobacterales bacterium]
MNTLLARLEKLPLLDRIFDVSITLKGLDGVLEVIGGVLLLFLTPSRLNAIVEFLTQHELSQDPKDFIATHLLFYAQRYTATTALFLAFYLFSHGIIKIIIVVALLQQRLWAYPLAIVVLGLFIVYQIYRLALQVSFGLLALTLFDIFIVGLTVLEYRKHRARVATAS